MTKEHKTSLIPIERIEQQIYLMHGDKVMLDSDLARLSIRCKLFASTKQLNETATVFLRISCFSFPKKNLMV